MNKKKKKKRNKKTKWFTITIYIKKICKSRCDILCFVAVKYQLPSGQAPQDKRTTSSFTCQVYYDSGCVVYYTNMGGREFVNNKTNIDTSQGHKPSACGKKGEGKKKRGGGRGEEGNKDNYISPFGLNFETVFILYHNDILTFCVTYFMI